MQIVSVPGSLIKQSNEVVRSAKIDVASPTAANVLFGLIACLKVDDSEFQSVYKVRYADLFPGYTNEAKYSQAVEVCQSLRRTGVDIETYDEAQKHNKSGGMTYAGMPFFMKIGYKDGYVYASFNPEMKPYLLNLRKNFTTVDFHIFAKMDSIYAKEIYQLIQSWKDRAEFTMPLDELQNLLNVPDIYRTNFSLFRTRVLLQAQKEINIHAGRTFDFQGKKEGRKVVAVRFILDHKKTLKLHKKTRTEAAKKAKAEAEAITAKIARVETKGASKLSARSGFIAGKTSTSTPPIPKTVAEKVEAWNKAQAQACAIKRDGDCLFNDHEDPAVCAYCAEHNVRAEVKGISLKKSKA